ncbi:hypothetical protein BGZ70_000268, partial [Mortierella alpina]
MAASAPEVAGGSSTGQQPRPGGDHPTAPSASSSSSSLSSDTTTSATAATHTTTATTATSASIVSIASTATDSSASSSPRHSAVLDPTLASTLDSFPKPATALPPSKPASNAATPRRILTPAASHRRNQSQDHVTFSKLPASPSALATSFSNKPDLRTSPLSPMARSSSMPVAGLAGHGPSAATMSSIPTTAASAERETYTLSDRTSTVVQTTGQIPPPLIGSTSIIHRNRLYLFGGRPVGGNPTNDLYVLSLDSQ